MIENEELQGVTRRGVLDSTPIVIGWSSDWGKKKEGLEEESREMKIKGWKDLINRRMFEEIVSDEDQMLIILVCWMHCWILQEKSVGRQQGEDREIEKHGGGMKKYSLLSSYCREK